jgi:Tfp pilus assembly PilM family ATPase
LDRKNFSILLMVTQRNMARTRMDTSTILWIFKTSKLANKTYLTSNLEMQQIINTNFNLVLKSISLESTIKLKNNKPSTFTYITVRLNTIKPLAINKINLINVNCGLSKGIKSWKDNKMLNYIKEVLLKICQLAGSQVQQHIDWYMTKNWLKPAILRSVWSLIQWQ